MINLLKLRTIHGVLLLLAPWLAAMAENENTQNAGATLEEIVVTAQKRAESLQDTPLSITAIDADVIAQRGIMNIGDLGSVAPNLVVNQNAAATSNPIIYIRGIGESDPILTADPSVGLYVDGVIIGRSAGSLFDMVDLERVEVLRGPQGTLYGRNTTGGAVNLISAKPAKEMGGKLSVGYGRFHQLQAKALLNTGELADSGFALQLSYYHQRRDGVVDNLLQPDDDKDPGARDVEAMRLALGYDKGGRFSMDYAFDYSDRQGYSNAFQLRALRPDIIEYLSLSPVLGGTAPVVSNEHLDTLNLDFDGEISDKVEGHTLTAQLEVSDSLLIKSITGYREWDNDLSSSALDGNGGLMGFLVSPEILAPPNPFNPLGIGPVDLFHTSNQRHQKQFSQEFNAIGSINDLDYVAGLYYFREQSTEHNPQSPTLVLPVPNPIPITPTVSTSRIGVPLRALLDYKHTSESTAAFGQVTWSPDSLDNRLSVTGGMRYTHDKKRLQQTSSFVRDVERSFSNATWMLNAAYNWTDNVMTYARASTGYKAGGVSARSANDGYSPEKLTSYELGLKSELFERVLRVNLVGFYSIYDDLQVSQFLAGSGGATSITVNAGEARYQGFETEVAALLATGLQANATYGYVDREYKSFEVLDTATNQIVDIADSARFPYSADTTVNVGLQYDTYLADLVGLTLRLDWTYRSDVYWHPANPFNDAIADDSVGVFNARATLAGFTIGDTRLSVALWGKNLTDESYLLSGIDFGSLGFAGVSYADPRTYGMDISLEF